ncbi:MAG: hypothetical protein SF172_16210 [Burkholderiales bacterium]|nr:hypothetical protein [Burkholderiales bacterium]
MIPASQIKNPEVLALANEASAFISSQAWCKKVTAVRLAWACAGVLGVFQVDLQPTSADVDSTLWVVVGDLPPAYLVLDQSPSWKDALRGYVAEMSLWVRAVKGGLPLEDLIPVAAEPSHEHAEMLASRLAFIEARIISAGDGDVEGDT